MVMKFFARCIVAGAVATIVLALATDASFAAKQRSGPRRARLVQGVEADISRAAKPAPARRTSTV